MLSAGKNSTPLLSSRAVPPWRSGVPAAPATATTNSCESTGGVEVSVIRAGPFPNVKKSAAITPAVARIPMTVQVWIHHGSSRQE